MSEGNTGQSDQPGKPHFSDIFLPDPETHEVPEVTAELLEAHGWTPALSYDYDQATDPNHLSVIMRGWVIKTVQQDLPIRDVVSQLDDTRSLTEWYVQREAAEELGKLDETEAMISNMQRSIEELQAKQMVHVNQIEPEV